MELIVDESGLKPEYRSENSNENFENLDKITFDCLNEKAKESVRTAGGGLLCFHRNDPNWRGYEHRAKWINLPRKT